VTIDPQQFRDIDPGQRVLMGPGPSDVPPRVLQAMSAPCIGHLDPYFLAAMDETQRLLRFLFQTDNGLTIPVSGTGSAGMETCFVNLIEPGDEVVVCVNGVFGTRMSDIVGRIGGKLIRVDAPWGRAIDPEAVRQAVRGKNPKVLAVVHAETSTGVCQPLEDLAAIAREVGALYLVDTVTSLGGMEVAVDRTGIDAVYSGTQKCLSCPPGLAPISFSPAAIKALRNRKTPVVSWYLDMGMVAEYWGATRKYHHTAPVNMIYALREALRIIAEEGLAERFARHRLNHRALVAGVEAMGLAMVVPEAERLPMLNTIHIPPGADDKKVRAALLKDFGIEIGGGLGEFAGKAWRVGLMGHACRPKNVFLLLSALETILKAEGVAVQQGALDAAAAVYAEGPGARGDEVRG
jgi:alanine-glyoxylate transaminase/serine-glyoxylate transaminase/serine-pyruvate transaminase